MNRATYADALWTAIQEAIAAHPDTFKVLGKITADIPFTFSNGWPLKGGAAGYALEQKFGSVVDTGFDSILPHQQESKALTAVLNPRLPSRAFGAVVAGAIVHLAFVLKRSACDAQGNDIKGGGFEKFTPEKGPNAGSEVLRRFSPSRLSEFKDAMAELGVVAETKHLDPKDTSSPKRVFYTATGPLAKILQKLGKVTEGPVRLNIPEPKPSRTITVTLGEKLNLVTGSLDAAIMVAEAIPGATLLVATEARRDEIRATYPGVKVYSKDEFTKATVAEAETAAA